MASADRVMVRVLVALAFVITLALSGRSVMADEGCLRCHATLADAKLREPAEAWRQSVHALGGASESVGCTACHGGDGSDPTVRAHARETGFVARPPRADIPRLCGGCHADARFVRRF